MVTRIRSNRYREIAITAADVWSEPIALKKGGVINITGDAMSASVAVQRQNVLDTFDTITDSSGNAILYTTRVKNQVLNPNFVPGIYRIGCSAFTSATNLKASIEGK